MLFSTPLVPGTLIRRYKRFLADIRLDSGEEVTAHCPNPGAMTGLKDPGLRVWVEPVSDPKRKLRFGWKLAELPGDHLAGIDTALPNRVVKEALSAQAIPQLAAYGTVRPEVRYLDKSRVDFLLQEPGLQDVYLEVKNVHLRRDADWAEFPDSVTTRGARHMGDLAAMVAKGHRGILLYLVQRSDCTRMRLAADIDPSYAAAAAEARAAGVETLCFGTRITRDGVWLAEELPFAPAGSGTFHDKM